MDFTNKILCGDWIEVLRTLVRTLDGRRFIRWKDSIRDVIEKEPQRILATESMEDTENDGIRQVNNGID